jgi:hypothetical protein
MLEPQDATVSFRRLREEKADDDQSWRLADLPAKRSRQSKREINIPVPASIFWDPYDKSTHHHNYPRMLTSDYQNYSEYTRMKGERFAPGQLIFETIMRHFRSSRPSLKPKSASRASSEPTKEEERCMLMKLEEQRDELIPFTVYTSNLPTPGEPDIDSSITSPVSQSAIGNDFQTPKRILAKVIATPESCLPTITLDLIDRVTSWGRGHSATVRYTNGQETRIPKYAFKIFLFKPGFYTNNGSSPQAIQAWKDEDQNMTFYISSKASIGIWINNTNLPSYERQNPSTPSKFWGELRHGDYITVWFNDQDNTKFTQFRFECFWGNSRQERHQDEEFKVLEDGELLNEIERTCLAQEKGILANHTRREEEEKEAIRKEKGHKKLLGERPANFTQSSKTPQEISSILTNNSRSSSMSIADIGQSSTLLRENMSTDANMA